LKGQASIMSVLSIKIKVLSIMTEILMGQIKTFYRFQICLNT